MGRFELRRWRSAAGVSCLLMGTFCPAQESTTQQTPAAQADPQQKPSEQKPADKTPAAQLPDAPAPTKDGIAEDERQTKRVLGIMPNFRSVSPGEVVPEPTVAQKFKTTSLDNFDYTALFFAGIIAADSMASKGTPEFHQGAKGYARYYWHTVADQSVENYFVEFIGPTILHADSRYYALGKRGGGFWKRAGYSLTRAVVTRKDDGKPAFNYSEVGGAGAAVAVSMFYYPSPERTVKNGFRNWGLDIGYDSVTFMFHEFWPDISYALFAKKPKKAPPMAATQ
jgi:hypothetical protein